MKKKSSFITNERGFFLPFVLFFTIVIFMLIMASIKSYQNDVIMTHRLSEHVKIETLYQMGLARFKNDLASQENLIDERTNHFFYQFPSGQVDITSERKDDYLYLAYIITTDKGVSSSTITNIIPVSEVLTMEMSQTNE
ncbi:MAG TPA: hypothetical protein VIG73_15305 [Cerasibacillus sp.]|uniref:hypothetical protein n=1 Tax=Cerasibacillus sp. TaxID=2498711 RepID=UPI002F429070